MTGMSDHTRERLEQQRVEAQIEARRAELHTHFWRYSQAFPYYTELRIAAELLGPTVGPMSDGAFRLTESWPSLYRVNRWLTQFDEAVLARRMRTVLAGREWTLEDAHWRDGEE